MLRRPNFANVRISKSLNKTAGATPDFIEIGFINRPHGVRGALKITVYNPESEFIQADEELFLGNSIQQLKAHLVTRVQKTNKGFIIYLEDLDTMEAAEALRGQKLWIDKQRLAPSAENEYYLHELLGMQVVDPHNRLIGTVSGLEPNIGADNLIVKGEKLQYMIPMIADAIASIDRQKRRITLTNMEGLLDHGF